MWHEYLVMRSLLCLPVSARRTAAFASIIPKPMSSLNRWPPRLKSLAIALQEAVSGFLDACASINLNISVSSVSSLLQNAIMADTCGAEADVPLK